MNLSKECLELIEAEAWKYSTYDPEVSAFIDAAKIVLTTPAIYEAAGLVRNDYPIGGYAPGSYWCKCCDCKQTFMGDKRAVQCEPCAIKMISNDR